jgi:glutathione S-transferase
VKAPTEEEKAENLTQTFAMLEQLEGAFKKCSSGKYFFGGDAIGFVDVTLGSQLTWLNTVEKMSGIKLLDETKVPLLGEWAKRFLAVDSMERVLPSVERLQEYVRWLQETRWKVASAK